ncbi:hypothetical protein EVAR_59809_1 [Eumeta japonica]|uniref:Uncharacterized protein n=1 Tax=Eumeta variegata TaxID=151549 RepID=A0A4C1YGX9_EUMVA|nr:hypothetical protein EVAR_59809_1 [Eumeta japonica]
MQYGQGYQRHLGMVSRVNYSGRGPRYIFNAPPCALTTGNTHADRVRPTFTANAVYWRIEGLAETELRCRMEIVYPILIKFDLDCMVKA